MADSPASSRQQWDPFPYLLMAPGILLVTLVTLYPIYFAVHYSLMETRVFEQIAFVGLANFERLLTDPRFHTNLSNSVFFVFVSVALAWFFGLSLALLLRKPTWGNAILKTIILIPWVTNQVVLALIWKWMLSGEASPITYFLSLLGFPFFDPLISTTQALPALTFINAWRATGFALLLMLAGLAAIPQEIEEAAEIDGASRFKKILFVIIPMLKPISLVCMITLTISFFNIVVLALDLTGGGPLNATELVSLRLYREGFQFYNIATASTLTLVMVILDLVLSLIYFRLIRAEALYK